MTDIADTNQDFELFKKFADEARAKPSFGAGFFDHDYKTGNWFTKNKNKEKINSNGRQLGADVPDVMIGWARYDETTRRFEYRVVRVADGVPPPKREELGDPDSWQFVRIMPVFDDETHEQFVIVAKGPSGYEAIGAVADGWVDNNKYHPEDRGKVPLIALCSESYLNKKDNKTNYNPTFDIVGWIIRPSSLRHIRPPAAASPAPTTNKNDGGHGIADEIPF
jgi:hypothetical protein